MKFNEQDKAALREFTDFVIDPDGESAVAAGDMEVVLSRSDDDALRLLIKFPGGQELVVALARQRLLKELKIKAGES